MCHPWSDLWRRYSASNSSRSPLFLSVPGGSTVPFEGSQHFWEHSGTFYDGREIEPQPIKSDEAVCSGHPKEQGFWGERTQWSRIGRPAEKAGGRNVFYKDSGFGVFG